MDEQHDRKAAERNAVPLPLFLEVSVISRFESRDGILEKHS